MFLCPGELWKWREGRLFHTTRGWDGWSLDSSFSTTPSCNPRPDLGSGTLSKWTLGVQPYVGSGQPHSVSVIWERRSDLLLSWCASLAGLKECSCLLQGMLCCTGCLHAFECLFLTGSSDCLTSFYIDFQHLAQSRVQPPFVCMTGTLERSLPKLSNNLEFNRYSLFFSLQMKTFAQGHITIHHQKQFKPGSVQPENHAVVHRCVFISQTQCCCFWCRQVLNIYSVLDAVETGSLQK